MIISDSPLMTLEQAAAVAGCSSTYLRRLVKNGRVEAGRMAGGRPLMTERTALEIRKTLSSRAVCNREKPKAKRKPSRPSGRRSRG